MPERRGEGEVGDIRGRKVIQAEVFPGRGESPGTEELGFCWASHRVVAGVGAG